MRPRNELELCANFLYSRGGRKNICLMGVNKGVCLLSEGRERTCPYFEEYVKPLLEEE